MGLLFEVLFLVLRLALNSQLVKLLFSVIFASGADDELTLRENQSAFHVSSSFLLFSFCYSNFVVRLDRKYGCVLVL